MDTEDSTAREGLPQRETIGIVGGLGPRAHIALESRILDAAETLLGARKDQDFPEWILSSIPRTPDRTLAMKGLAGDPTDWLVASIRRLQGYVDGRGRRVSGADFAIIACISAHGFLQQVASRVDIPVLNMVQITAGAIARSLPGAKVGLLATTGTLEAGFLHIECVAAGLSPVSLLDLPDGRELQRRLVMETIYGRLVDGKPTGGGIKGRGVQPADIEAFERAAGIVCEHTGAQAIVAGCTEIGLALSRDTIAGVPVYDPMRIIATAAVKRAFGLEAEGHFACRKSNDKV